MQQGDIVQPKPGAYSSLTSGCSRYNDAIVLSVEPFQLVSRGGDMLWYCTVKREDFVVTSRATAEEMAAVEHRRLPL